MSDQSATTRRRSPHPATIAFFLYVLAVVVVRYVILTDRAAPATIDSGNWLAFGESLLGREIRSESLAYPPVVPLGMAVLTRLFGAVIAVGLLGSITAVLPAVGAWAALRTYRLTWGAAFLAALLVPVSATGEATAWGGFPQLIGVGMVPVFLVLLDRVLRRGDWRLTVACYGAAAVLVLTSHFATIYAALGAVVLGGLWLATRPGFDVIRRRIPNLAVIALPGLIALPLYLPLLTAVSDKSPEEADVAGLGLTNLLEATEFTYRDVPILWRVLLGAALFAPVLLRDRWRTSPWQLTVAAVGATALAALVSREARYLYFIPFATVLALGLWTLELRRVVHLDRLVARSAVAAALVALLAFQTVSGLRLFADQRDFYGIVSPGLDDAMEWLADNTEDDVVIAVSTVDDAPVGWWVEGRVGREVVYASPLRWLSYDDEIERARLGNDIFSLDFPDDEALALAQDNDIDVLLVATESNRYDPETMDAFLEDHPDAVLYRNNGAVVIDVDAAIASSR